jgi:hypothetical protein
VRNVFEEESFGGWRSERSGQTECAARQVLFLTKKMQLGLEVEVMLVLLIVIVPV